MEFGAQAVRYCSDDGQGRCWACWQAYEERREAVRHEQAAGVAAERHRGAVYWQNRDRYFADATEAFMSVQDQVLGGEIERVQVRVYACLVSPFRLTTEGVLGRALEGHAPGSEFDQEARLVMSSFLELWNQRYANQVESWVPDFSQKVIFPDVWWASIPDVEE